VIRYGLVVALLMTWATAILTMLQAFALTSTIIVIVSIMIIVPVVIGILLFLRGREQNSDV
jgi:hypothetical protein